MANTYISVALRRQIRKDARHRCGYCHTPEAFVGMPLDIDHIWPESLGGETARDNLWLACSPCNTFKGDRTDAIDPETDQSVPLFNPRTQHWSAHFEWDVDGVSLIGRTPIGRATIVTLRLNNEYITNARRFWVGVGRWPPSDDFYAPTLPDEDV